jgi:hypothetical protein
MRDVPTGPQAESEDGAARAVPLPDPYNTMSAAELDVLIHRLVEQRSRLLPGYPALPGGSVYWADNMLWHVRPARAAPALEFSIHHAGLGWISILLSRAQIEDLLRAVELAARDLPGVADMQTTDGRSSQSKTPDLNE